MGPAGAGFEPGARHEFWTGLRPLSPDGLPLVGQAAGGPGNVWLNCGHGSLGWTQVHRSLRVTMTLGSVAFVGLHE